MSYEITVSITALCPCCGEALPSGSYLTEFKSLGHPLERDNPYERKDRRVFITPCENCFKPESVTNGLLKALQAILENDGGEGSKCFSGSRLYEARQAGRAAIAKALGEQA